MALAKIAKIAGIVLGVGAIAGVASWYLSQPRERELNAVMEELSIRTARDFSKDMPRLQDLENLLVITKIGGRDEDKRLRDIVLEAVERERKYTVITWSGLQEKFSEGGLWQQFIERIGLLDDTAEPRTPEQVQSAVKYLGQANLPVDGALFIKCIFDQGPRDDALGASVELQGRFYDIKKKKELDHKVQARHAIDSTWNRLYLTHKLENFGFFPRILIFVLLLTLKPWALIGLVRMVLKKRENAWVFAAIGLFVAVDVLAAWPLLMTLGTIGLGSLVFFIIIGGASAYYNYDAFDYIQRRLL